MTRRRKRRRKRRNPSEPPEGMVHGSVLGTFVESEETKTARRGTRYMWMIDPNGYHASWVNVAMHAQHLKLGFKDGAVGDEDGMIDVKTSTVHGVKAPPPDPLIAQMKPQAAKMERDGGGDTELAGRVDNIEKGLEDLTAAIGNLTNLLAKPENGEITEEEAQSMAGIG